MKCPHCLVEFHDDRQIVLIGNDSEGTWGLEKYDCANPDCKRMVLILIRADIKHNRNNWKYYILEDGEGNERIYEAYLIRPRFYTRKPVPREVPENLAKDYLEACAVVEVSPKASAAISRRCLQNLLRTAGGVKKDDLAREIQQVLDSGKLPSYLADSIDAIRNIGNYAAHPLKSSSTGEIVDVEPGEAEWTLDVLELLFDFYFVQPEIIRQKREALNSKLSDIGKPPLK